MRILSQKGNYMINLESFLGLTTAIKHSEKPDKSCVNAVSRERGIVNIGEYSTEEKANTVLAQIFEHKGETFIMPQDEEVEG